MSSIKLRCLDDSSNNIFVVDSIQGVSSTNTTSSSNATTGGLVLYGGLSINQTSNVSSMTRGGAVTIAGGVSIAKDLYVGGNIVSSNLGSTTASASFGQVFVFGTQDSLNYTSGSVITVGGITVQNSTNSASLTNGGALLVAGGASIGRDVYIGGNLTVLGSQTNVVSQTLNIGDNLVVINSGPSSTRDAGVLIQRFQTTNDSGTGDVVNDTAAFSTIFVSASGTTAVFNIAASSSDNFYNGWFIRVTSGTGTDQVRRITSYTGGTRTATLASAWTTAPSLGDGVSFYNRVYASQFYQKASDSFVLGFTSDDPGSSSITLRDYTSLATGAVSVFSTVNSTGVGTGGALTVAGGAAVSNRLFVGGGVVSLSTTNTLGNIFTSGGNLGIGTTSPGQRLVVVGSPISNSVEIQLQNNSVTASSLRIGIPNVAGTIISNAVAGAGVITNDGGPLQFGSGATAGSTGIMIINTSGNVGIGTTGPTTTLDISGSVRITSGNLIASGDSNTIGNLFTTGGNVGIGISSPLSRLSITPNSDDAKITLYDGGDPSNHYGFGITGFQLNYHVIDTTANHVFYAGGKNGDGTELIRITGTGNAILSGNANGERGLTLNNTNNGDSAYSVIRLGNDNSNNMVVFLNSSTRTTDGGAHTCTLRNETGSLRLQGAGGMKGIWIASTTGNVGISNSGPTYTLDVGGTFQVSGVSALVNNSNTLGNLYTTGGNVGINNMAPAYKLDVNGSTNINGDLDVTGSINGGGSSSSTFAYLTLTATDEAISLISGSMVTFGGVTIQAASDATSPTSGGGLLTQGGAAIGKRLFVGDGIVSTNSNTIGGLIATSTGNIGIGTTSPQATLDVNGAISAANLLINNETVSNLRVTTLLSSGNLQSQLLTTGTLIATGNVQTIGNLFTTGGNVGVGTISPAQRLEVSGAIKLSTNTSPNNDNVGVYIYDQVLVGPTIAGSNFEVRTGGNNPRLRITSTGSIGIGTTAPSHQLHLTNTQIIDSTQSVVDTNITTASGGALNVSGDITIGGTRGIHFVPLGLASPSTTTRSLGTKINLLPVLSASVVDFAIGVENANMWFSTSTRNDGFKWYQNTTNTMTLAANGNLFVNSTTNATGVGTGGALTVAGGTSITNDLYVGGTLNVNGQNLSIISGTTTIGNYSGTGVLTINNIAIGRTMNNTNYKLIGSLITTSIIANVYTVSFSNITTTTFNANVLRIDSLFSGWSDANLVLSWQVIP